MDIEFWDTDTGNIITTLTGPDSISDLVRELAYDPEHTSAIVWDGDATYRITITRIPDEP